MNEPIILDGKKLSKLIEAELINRVEIMKARGTAIPTLATILVGNDPSSKAYVNMKRNACARVGINSELIHLPEDASTEDLLETIDRLNKKENVYGILLQHPVPKQIDERLCFDRIELEKDVDGVTSYGFGRMSMKVDACGSATPGGIMKLLHHYNLPLSGKHAVVVGRSPILGKPMAMMLLNEDATVTICHSKTIGLQEIVKSADIVVGAVGIPEYIKSDWIKDRTILIDAGYHPGGIGDIELEHAKDRSFAYTPVPGGVGPMTIATLISQTVESAERKLLH